MFRVKLDENVAGQPATMTVLLEPRQVLLHASCENCRRKLGDSRTNPNQGRPCKSQGPKRQKTDIDASSPEQNVAVLPAPNLFSPNEQKFITSPPPPQCPPPLPEGSIGTHIWPNQLMSTRNPQQGAFTQTRNMVITPPLLTTHANNYNSHVHYYIFIIFLHYIFVVRS